MFKQVTVRNLLFLLVFCTCFFGIPFRSQAQKRTLYFAWTMGPGTLFYPYLNEQMRISFPYTVTDASGKTIQNTFNSQAINPYRAPERMFSAFNWEVGNLKHFAIFRLTGNDNMALVSLGYGRSYYFDFPGMKKRKKSERTFAIKPSINISYNHYGNNTQGAENYLGSLDNYNNTLHVLGRSSGPTFSWTTDDPRQTNTDSTETLSIYYVQNEWALIPRLSISNNPHKYGLYYEASIGYYMPHYDRGGITMYQNDWNKIAPNRPISISTNNISSTLNGKKISNAPHYRFSGFVASVTIGFCVSQLQYDKCRNDLKLYKLRFF